MSDLYQSNRESLWKHCSYEHNLHLLESEAFELWLVSTQSCREEIRRLERLARGRTQDCEELNQELARLNAELMEARGK